MFAAPSTRYAATSRFGKGGGKAGGYRTQQGKGRGFTPGKKLWGNQVLHRTQDFLSKYPGKSRVGETGGSSALWEGLQKPQMLVSPEAFASGLAADNTELINRPGVGLSELSGCFLNLNEIIEGLAKDILAPKLDQKWRSLWTTHELEWCCQVLNQNDYPDMQRTVENLQYAVRSALTVDSSWILAFASLTTSGVFAEKSNEVPLEGEELEAKKAALLEKPGSGKRLVELLTACVLSRYTHLGTIRANSADVVGDIQRRPGLAEKRNFVFSLVLSRHRHMQRLRRRVSHLMFCPKFALLTRAVSAASAIPLSAPMPHMAKRHGAAAHAAVGSACQACMRQFWSTARLRQHLRSSQGCAGAYEGADLDAELPVAKDQDQRLPPVPLVGPKPFSGSLRPPPTLYVPTAVDVGSQFPANHSGSSCVLPIIQHFRRLLATYGRDQAVSILATFAPTGEYGQLAKLAARVFVAPTSESWSERTGNLTIMIRGSQLAYGPHSAVEAFGPALFTD
ncbi:unnamed protein product [Symbiodinium microadriaticum]|nr:unnamed protein product [Symbiodinium microadriaticum]CAE7947795.1 unnamed protein product [Symbiodinium sp. KB8]